MRHFQYALGAALAVATVLCLTIPADAYPIGRFGYGYGGGYGGYGGYGAGLGYGGYGGYGRGYGGYGPGYYGGYYPSLSYSGYTGSNYPGYYGRSMGYYPGYGYNWNSYYPAQGYSSNYYVPTVPSYQTPASADSGVARSSTGSRSESMYYSPPAEDNTARVRIMVPADAQVWVDGQLTRQSGDRREFVSPPLDPNKTYGYEVKARWMNEGSPVEETRRIKVRANQTTNVDFAAVAERDK